MRRTLWIAVVVLLAGTGCAGEQGTLSEEESEDRSLVVYSGRSKELVGPVIELFTKETGIEVDVRYGETAEMAAQILEEGENSPADVFFAQDAGALGAVAKADAFAELPEATLDRVPAEFRSPDGLWVGTSGRVRVLVYNTEELAENDLPGSVLDLTEERWRGRVGWAPTNGSFQAFVTALRQVEGEEAARDWLEGMKANETEVYDGNSAIVSAVAAGEIDAGLVNHYYLLEMGSEDSSVAGNAANHFFDGGDVGSLVNVAGVGILEGANNADEAREFVDFMLSRDAKQYFDEEVFEYPLGGDAPTPQGLPDLDDIEQPDVDLSDLDDLEGTLDLLKKTAVL